MRAFMNLHAAKRVDLRSNVIVFRDDQRSLDRRTESIVGAESHGSRCFANRGYPDRPSRSRQRTRYGTTTRHPIESRLEQLQQDTASGIVRIHRMTFNLP